MLTMIDQGNTVIGADENLDSPPLECINAHRNV